VRAADRLQGVEHERLVVRVGDACDPDFVEHVARGHDSIISTLGPRWPTRAAASVYSRSGDAIATASWSAGPERVLVTSSALLFPARSWWDSLLKRVVWPIVEQAEQMEEHVRGCEADWTIVRTSFLSDRDDETCQVAQDALPDGGGAVSRAAVAAFLLRELDRGDHRRRVVGICA